MNLTGQRRIPAPRDAVWQALNDPEVLRACVPGCTALERTSDTAFAARVETRVGPVKAALQGTVTLSDADRPRHCRLAGEGRGAAGFARGEASVTLTEDGAGTTVDYTATAQVGGRLAQVGARLIDGAARKLADDFFAAFADAVAPAAESPAPPGTAMAGATAGGGLAPPVWAAGLIGAVGVLWLVFGL